MLQNVANPALSLLFNQQACSPVIRCACDIGFSTPFQKGPMSSTTSDLFLWVKEVRERLRSAAL